MPPFCAPDLHPTAEAKPSQPQQQQQQPPSAWVDIDARSAANPLACADLAPSIFDDLKQSELDPALRPSEGYRRDLSTAQPDMTPHMRAILVDWLVEVAQEYRLCSDTLFLAVSALDRFLSRSGPVARERLQLAGVACMWLASKYEEIYAPGSRDFVYITDGTYTRQELVDAEAAVLATLSFRLTQPTAKTFLRRHLQAAAADERLHYLSSYLCELSLLSERALALLPSQMAAASVYVASLLLGAGGGGGGAGDGGASAAAGCPWTPTLERYTGWSLAELQPAIAELLTLHEAMSASFGSGGGGSAEGEIDENAAPEEGGGERGGGNGSGVAANTATRDKYSSSKLLRVSEIPPLSVQRPALAMSYGIAPRRSGC
jgi:cyclin A